jgi:hypothetical protein
VQFCEPYFLRFENGFIMLAGIGAETSPENNPCRARLQSPQRIYSFPKIFLGMMLSEDLPTI